MLASKKSHTLSVPGPLWRDLVSLRETDPSLCPSARGFVLSATRHALMLVRAGKQAGQPAPDYEAVLGPSVGPRSGPPTALESSEVDRVLHAIGKAGPTGITSKQLSSVTELAPESVAQIVRQLAGKEQLSKFGRGLWVLARYAEAQTLGESSKGPDWYTAQFASDFGVGLGRYSGDIQFSPNEQLAAHRWWPYVQGFSADFVAQICRRYDIGEGSVVLDPFCGSGTVPVVARLLGARAIGVDIMPIVAFVAAAKCEWSVDPRVLTKLAEGVLANRTTPTIAPPFLRETSKQFSPEVLQSLLRIKESIWGLGDGPAQVLLRLAFSSILIECSNLKRAPCLGYAKKRGLDAGTPFRLLSQAVSKIAEDLSVLQASRENWGPPASILLGSSGVLGAESNTVDLAVTSPPYVNGMDYPTNYKIDLAWLGFIDSYSELASLRASMVACDNIPRKTATEHRPSMAVAKDEWIGRVAGSIDANIRAKGAYRREDMSSIVRKYFDDLVPVMARVYESLRPGRRFVVVNGDSLIAGTYVPGDMIFARLASGVGFEVEALELARTRRSGQRRGYLLRETVLTLRKPDGRH